MRQVSKLLSRGLAAAKARSLFLAAFFLAVLVPFVLFGALAEEILEGHGLPFDEPILRWFHAQATPARDRSVVAITTLGGPVPMAVCEVVVVAALFLRGRSREA